MENGCCWVHQQTRKLSCFRVQKHSNPHYYTAHSVPRGECRCVRVRACGGQENMVRHDTDAQSLRFIEERPGIIKIMVPTVASDRISAFWVEKVFFVEKQKMNEQFVLWTFINLRLMLGNFLYWYLSHESKKMDTPAEQFGCNKNEHCKVCEAGQKKMSLREFWQPQFVELSFVGERESRPRELHDVPQLPPHCGVRCWTPKSIRYKKQPRMHTVPVLLKKFFQLGTDSQLDFGGIFNQKTWICQSFWGSRHLPIIWIFWSAAKLML